MEWVVTTGRTVEEAKEAALDELGVDEADAEFEVLEEPRQGLFGRQRGEARVRARVRPTSPRPKLDRRDRRRKSADRASSGPAEAGPSEESATPAPGRAKPAVAASKTVRRRGARTTPAGEASVGNSGDDGGPVKAATKAPAKAAPRRRAKAAGTEPEGEDEEPVVSDASDDTMSLAEQGDVARQFVSGLVTQFGATAEVEVVIDEETLEIRVVGDELGLLIGPKGQTLAAVQELARTVVQRRTPGRTGRLFVDVAGYRQRRREALARFTQQVAADVVATGVQKVLEAMSAADRKVVHDTATDIAGVRTTSEGEEPHRRVVIIPDGSTD